MEYKIFLNLLEIDDKLNAYKNNICYKCGGNCKDLQFSGEYTANICCLCDGMRETVCNDCQKDLDTGLIT